MNIHFPNFSKAHVLVVGDLMLDRYWFGATSRISPEAPVPIVHINQSEERPGGAGNVALNLSSLLVDVNLMGIIGNDVEGELLERKLNVANIKTFLQRTSLLPTITKLRVLSQHQQLIRLDFEKKIQYDNQEKFLTQYQQLLEQNNIVVLSDYGKGTLNSVEDLIAAARKKNVPVLVDPKGNDFRRYKGATIITPNYKEFEAVVGHCHDEKEICQKGKKLIKDLQLKALLVTRGEHGMTLIQQDGDEFHLPAKAREVFDVTGAGDTVIAVLAATIAAGESFKDAVTLANLAAGIVVSRLGAATVSAPELRRYAAEIDSSLNGVVNEEQLLIAIQDAKAHGEKIVVTNGCFDILHAGHVTYLAQAKELGNRLIVLVNDDNSVKRLKGADRPINSVERRMHVLAGLQSVDWVVPFSEDTPERLIKAIMPDVLTKGGDYKVEDIAGAKAVLENGGEVKILPFVEGCSTTAIVEKMRK